MTEDEKGAKRQTGPRGFEIVGEGAEGPSGEQAATAPPVTFGTFVLSLSTSALALLGEVPNPETGEPATPNLILAQQTIDVLEMLHEKTQGNLADDEKHLLEAILHDLHLRYVRVRGAKKD